MEVDTQGDAFFVAFPRAADVDRRGSRRAPGARERPRPAMRIGIHTGEPIVTDEGYVGLDVHRAARIAAAAAHEPDHRLRHDPQTTRPRCGGPRPRRAPAKDLTGAGTSTSSARATSAAPHARRDEPADRGEGALVGRERELEELVARLSNGTRLLTLGPGGAAGKARLALQVAAELVGTQRDGVFWVRSPASPTASFCPRRSHRWSERRTTSPGSSAGRQLLLLLDLPSTSSMRPRP